MTTQIAPLEATNILQKFTSFPQLHTMAHNCYGEEGEFFVTLITKLAESIKNMPKVYEQDGKGDEAVVHLHYFLNGMDWYITERDFELGEQIQAFGLADLGMGYPELGYISIEELVANGAELDLYWTPKTLGEVKSA